MDGLNHTEIGVDIVDMDYKILSQNQFLKERFGDCTGKLCYKEYMNLENPCEFCPMEKTIKSSKVEKVELTAADGRDYELLSAPLTNPDGTVDRVIKVVRDITERKQAEEEIKSLAKFPSENPNPVMRISKDGTILYSNDAGLVLLKNRGTDIGKPVPDEFKEFVKKVCESNQYSTTEFTSLGKTSSYVFSHVKEGGYVNVYGIDITEKKKSEEKIREQNIQLKKLDELKTSFLNVTSHELRTPMTSIKGYVQMLLNQVLGGLSDEQRQGLDVILRNTNRLDSLIQDILDVSRLESGTMKFISGKTDIKTLVRQTAETMQPFADRKEITISADIEEGVPNLIVDGERIKQVMMNLVSNAIKFSPDGSIVNVKARKGKNDVLFEVQDFGRGIPKDKRDKTFETFYQVDSGADRKFGGAGLGLAVSKGDRKSVV